jgi:N-acyl-D-amino-acid deacylase
VYAQAYGWAERESRALARPDSLFRIASISKPITAVAVLQLAEAGKLSLATPAIELLPSELKPPLSQETDVRWRQVTVGHLLQHTGGWEREKSLDPMFRSREIAAALGVSPPTSSPDVIRYMFGRPLDFDPGTRYAYSNFGYCLLGRILESVSGDRYEAHVRRNVLEPIGLRRMRLGATLANRRASAEVRYYTRKNTMGPSVFPGPPERVPAPYGAFCLESMDAHGGWLAAAVDLARFAAALDDPAHSPLLTPRSFAGMYAPPPPPVARRPDGSLHSAYYACGWSVRPVGRDGQANYWHTGSLPGTYALLVRRWDGLSWAVLFNQRSEGRSLPDSAIDPALHRAANSVTDWPEHDLFPQYFGTAT